jgi:hypothetical protein
MNTALEGGLLVRIGLAVTTVMLALGLGTAHASLYTWAPTPSFTDALGDSTGGAASDLADVWWARDGVSDCWRFDLAAAPATPSAGDFYGAYMDITNGLFFNPPVLPFADALVGIEWTNILGSYAWTPFTTNGVMTAYGLPTMQAQVSGQTVEFRIDSTQWTTYGLPRDYNWAGVSGRATSLNFVPSHVDFDYTTAQDTAAVTPEPATLALLPLGCGWLLGRLRRRKAKKSVVQDVS